MYVRAETMSVRRPPRENFSEARMEPWGAPALRRQAEEVDPQRRLGKHLRNRMRRAGPGPRRQGLTRRRMRSPVLLWQGNLLRKGLSTVPFSSALQPLVS